MTTLLLVIALVGTLSSSAYLLLALIGAWRYRAAAKADGARPQFAPAVSLLKPVHGLEPGLEANLESFFRQDYPAYEILFCARHASDPALQIARKISARYPDMPCRILTSGEPPWTNAKVYSLAQMAAVAEHELLVISDSDVSVTPDYLRSIVTPFADEMVGVGTCLYRGVPAAGSFWSRLEALAMSVEMTSGVLVADMLEGMKFALGPTMVVRKQALAAIGGFARMADYCADDFLLGNWADEAGYKVALLQHPVEHHVVNRGMLDSLRHQVRWMRSTRFSRPKGHAGTALTYSMPFGVLGLIAGLMSHLPWLGPVVFAVTYANRVLQCGVVGYGVVEDRLALRDCWLYPLRDLMGFFLWCGSYASANIDWRGEIYRLTTGGRMVRPETLPTAAAAEDAGA